MMRRSDFTKVGLGVIAGALAGGAAIVGAQVAATDINACVISGPSNPGVPNVRIVRAGESCDGMREASLSWNRQGPQGPQGPVGAPGQIGPQGPAQQIGPATPPNVFSLDDLNYRDIGYKPVPGKTKVIKKSSPTNTDEYKYEGASCPMTYPKGVHPFGTFTVAGVFHPSPTPPHFELLQNSLTGGGGLSKSFWSVGAKYGPNTTPWRLTAIKFCSK